MVMTNLPDTHAGPDRDGRDVPKSPRLRILQQDLTQSGSPPTVLDAFWQEMEDVGTPLIEEHDRENGTALVTFLWRGDDELRNVVVIEWITEGDFPAKQMTLMPGSDVWYRSIRIRDDIRTSYQFAPNDSLVPKPEEKDWPTRFAGWRQDPLNTRPLIDPDVDVSEDGRSQASCVLELPNAPAQPWIEKRTDVAKGVVSHHRFESNGLQNTRDVWVYRPAREVQASAPVLVLFDGERHLDVLRVPTVLDNLFASGKVEPMVAVMVGNVDRGNELPCNRGFLTMLTDELMPWLAAETGVQPAPGRTVAAGLSYGGLAAMYCGLFAPETFGLVLSQSGSFWWKPDPMNEQTEVRIGDAPPYCWLPTQAATMEPGDIRVWMEVGTLEDRTHGSGGPTQMSANRHMRDVLVAKGVPVTFVEFAGGHDYACWRNSLADGLIHLLGK